MSKSKHINIALISKLELGGNILTLEMAHLAGKNGEVISGDYLEKKSLPGRKELFHIQYNTSTYECEHINAPYMVDNLAKIAFQSDVLIFVADLFNGITKDEMTVLEYFSDSNVKQVIVVLTFNSENQSEIDNDLSELAVVDAQENLNMIGFEKIHIMTGKIPNDVGEVAAKLLSLIDQDMIPRTYDTIGSPLFLTEKVYYVSDKGLKNAPVVYGFLVSGALLVGMELKVFGLLNQPINVRVRSLQLFGKEVGRCEAGRSVAVLLERVPKDLLEPGQILGGVDDQFCVEKEYMVKINVPSNLNEDPLIYFGARQKFEIWCNMGKVLGRWIDLKLGSNDNELIAKISLEKHIAIGTNNGLFLLLVGNRLCVGYLEAPT